MRVALLALLLLVGCVDPPDPPVKLAFDMVEFNAPDGERVYISPAAVTALRGEKTAKRGLYHVSVKCLIICGGQTIPVIEDCRTVENRLYPPQP